MSEVAGLTLGVIALASLFNSCVEVLQYIDDGRTYVDDYDLACTKIGILHQRLRNWGGALHIRDGKTEHPLLLEPATRNAVSKGLIRLSAILSDSEVLKAKYDPRPRTRALPSTDHRKRSIKAAPWSLQLRRRTTWSIRDKAKFDRLIHDVSFLVDNLEKVTATSSVAAQPDLAKLMPVDVGALTLRHSTEIMALGEQTGQPRRADGSAVPAPGAMPRTWEAPQAHRVEGKQTNEGLACGLQGFVEPAGGVYVVSGEQTNRGRSFGIQGAMSLQAYVATLHAQAQAPAPITPSAK
ncbi:hypothetical protein LTR53_015017 [Teratosphaeriaceae sp. CCFEE 6253]|nr:hypothetical protein LTR53_015017 [Teratosphaeriaceae sp. CCFEE 6253]